MKKQQKLKNDLLTSPWLVIGGAVILLIIVIIFSIDSAYREKSHMIRALTEKGESLVTAFEAGARTGLMRMRWGTDHLQRLIEETGKGPDIRHIVIADSTGKIISHSNPEMIGNKFDSQILKMTLESDKKPLYRIVKNKGGDKSFELFDIFKPMKQEGRQMRTGRGGGNNKEPGNFGQGNCNESLCMWGQGEQQIYYTPPLFISVGLDMTHFENDGKTKIKNALFMAGIILVLGLSGFISIFWLQNYRQTRQKLEDTSDFADKVISSLPVGLIATDSDGKIVVFNDTIKRISGISNTDATGKNLNEIVNQEVIKLILEQKDEEKSSEKEIRLSFGSGKSFYAGITVARINKKNIDEQAGLILILKDLTEIKELENSLVRQEKLAAIGNLSAGVAHEIRNPLSSIKGLATYFRDLFPEDSDNRNTANVMIKEVDRINRVIKDLLEFSKPSEISRSVFLLTEAVDHVFRLISADARNQNITTVSEIPYNLKVRMDRDRFSQILINLCRNSMEAMKNGGIINIKAEMVDRVNLHIKISDSGQGIDFQDINQIFNPYFTTKNDGTGLGLAVAQKIVEAHGGIISVLSEKKSGTSMIIEIPEAVV